MKIHLFRCSTSDKGLNEIAIHSNGLCVNILIKDKYKDISEELKRQAIEVYNYDFGNQCCKGL